MHTQQSLKQDAVRFIQQLPDDVDIDEIMYRLYVIDKIHRSREAIEKGEVISHEELLKEIGRKVPELNEGVHLTQIQRYESGATLPLNYPSAGNCLVG